MSETGRKMDVEDVLSSIRRLVSEESRTGSDAETVDGNTQNTDTNLLQRGNAVERDKLVLTPSMRVPESGEPAPAAADLEQRIADIESLVMSEAVEDAQSELAQNADVQDIEEIDSDEDEESLREMVSEMVRSELQGELGDRITRNVRKLVRREIYRALAAREFE